MHPILFSAFGFPVRTYGFAMTVAHLTGILFLLVWSRPKGKPLGPYIDLLLAVVVFGVIGARLGYAYNYWEEFQDDPWTLFSLWKGGLAFYGGFAPAFFAFLFVLWWRKIPVLETSDRVSPILPLSLALIRLGCFAQGCCFGLPTNLPWGVAYHDPESKVLPVLLGHPLHPTQLYEAVFLFCLSGALAWVLRSGRYRKVLRPGELATFSIFLYCVYRFAADFLRGDTYHGFWGLSWFTPTQAAALLGIAATPLVLWICRKVSPARS
ncbi:MAG TPA: prolipoprotein diacylglyceryl transferase [Bdellovibrionota bacterium]|jgi:phosphatidylglycerol:prolipoprotein diacylglycerol transferase